MYLCLHFLQVTITKMKHSGSSVNHGLLITQNFVLFLSYNAIQDWGKPGDLFNLNIQWHIPSREEKLLAKDLLDMFLQPELTKLERFVDESLTLSR